MPPVAKLKVKNFDILQQLNDISIQYLKSPEVSRQGGNNLRTKLTEIITSKKLNETNEQNDDFETRETTDQKNILLSEEDDDDREPEKPNMK